MRGTLVYFRWNHVPIWKWHESYYWIPRGKRYDVALEQITNKLTAPVTWVLTDFDEATNKRTIRRIIVEEITTEEVEL